MADRTWFIETQHEVLMGNGKLTTISNSYPPSQSIQIRTDVSSILATDAGISLMEALVIPSDADFTRIAPRDEDEIHDRQSETHWPPSGGHNQSVATGRNGVRGQ
jgi:hypothetical protein